MSSYEYVVNPYTNRRVSIYSKTGQQVLNAYLEHLGGGECAGHKNVEKCPTGCKKATNTARKTTAHRKRGDSYTYCTPEHHSKKKESRGRNSYDSYDRHETKRKPGRRGDYEGLASLGYGGARYM
jgi:hypothetical protein